MTGEKRSDHWRVFLASPGDVGEERDFVRHYLQNTLPQHPWVRDQLSVRVISWDDPDHGTPMPADLTPQQAVTRFHGRPSDCDVVIVILWSRMGTLLDVTKEHKPDGSPYLSGTEWEYLDAFNADPRPRILVYHRPDAPAIALDDPQFDDKRKQLGLVRDFIRQQFTNPDGSARGGYQPFSGVENFKHKVAADLEALAHEHLTHPPAAPTLPDTPPPSVTPPDRRQVGRDADTTAVVAALLAGTAPTAVMIQGVGGIGKTTLTRAAGTHPDVVTRFGPRRWFTPLETATSAEAAVTAILQALDLDPRLGLPAALARLAQAPALLVLDNLEPAWQADGPAVEDLLAQLGAVPGLALLVSFRGDDLVQGLAWSLRHTVQPLSRDDAAILFRAAAPGVAPDDPYLPLLLAALGGVPLAIVLTARRAVRPGPLAELWTEWQRVGTEVAVWRGSAPGRLTSVPHSIEFSLRSPRLTDAGRRLFRLLGALPAGLADADRTALLAAAAFDAREELLAVGLAVTRDGRLDLLPPVRDYARRNHAPDAAEAALWRGHYLALAWNLGGKIGETAGIGATERLAPEVSNLEAAFVAADDTILPDAARALFGYSRLAQSTGLGGTTVPRQLADACHTAGDATAEAQCLLCLGEIALARSDHAAARTAYEQALPLFRQVGAVLGEANCIARLGDIALDRSDHAAARAAYEQALPLFRQVGDVRGEANCIRSFGDIALERSDHAAARAAYEQALPLYRQVGDVLGEANCIQRLGDIALRRSDHAAARAAYEQALPLYRQVGDVLGEANCIQRLGDIALRRSDHAAARAAYEQALPLYRQVGDVQGEAACIRSLGDIALARSDHAAARAAYEQALPLYRQVGAVLGEANCIQCLGDIALDRSDHAAARAAYEQALPLYRQVGAVLGEANCIKSLGDIALRRSDHAAARAAYEQALPLYRQVGAVLGEAGCIKGLGDIALARSDHAAARAAYEQALPLYRQVGSVQGEANCIKSLGDLAREQGDKTAARERYLAALELFAHIPEPFSIGWTHVALARISADAERADHVAAARAAWNSIDRPDLVARLEQLVS